MPRARKHLVCLDSTPYYHVTARCVRRAFLCGVDRESGRSYEHRRGWIEDRIRVLASLFSIELCAYAVMSNHYHLVVKLIPEGTASWSDDEVLQRWTSLFRGPLLVQRYLSGEVLSEIEQLTLSEITSVFRQRLGSLSWFMKCLNEPIARRANAEDSCSGHFWEARFSSQPLCSEQVLIAAMVYVDLNPVRAQMASTPEQSDYTSIKARLESANDMTLVRRSVRRLLNDGELRQFNVAERPLLSFAAGDVSNEMTLPITQADYLILLDATGRIAMPNKRGRIDPAVQTITERLGLTQEQWGNVSSYFESHYRRGELLLKNSA
ncbi:MAG: transposase [Woeseiaceae bacterium]